MTRWYDHEGRHCKGRDRELFFPKNRAGELAAKAICRDCPVAIDCLLDELQAEGGRAASGRYGIRGGMTPEERVEYEKGPHQ